MELYLSLQAQDVALLISKLVRVAREEQAMLQECVELLSLVSALQVIIALIFLSLIKCLALIVVARTPIKSHCLITT
jgi:hypothetical protein